MHNTLVSDQKLRQAYLCLLFGAIVLPMLPIWQGGVRGLAAVSVLLILSWSLTLKLVLGLILALAGLASLGGWFHALLQSPVSHVIHSLTDVFGQPVGLLPDLSLLGFDLLLVSIFGSLLWHKHPTPISRLFIAGLSLFWLLSLNTLLSVATNGAEPEAIAQTATALSGWATWVYWAFLALLLFKSTQQLESAIKVIALAALLIGGIILIQWSIGDYSYFLGPIDASGEAFFRVRGTDYYHAPAALITALGTIVFFGWMRGHFTLWPTLGAVFLVGITILNNTRAVSLSLIAGLLALAGLLVLRRSWRIAALALAAVVAVTPNVMYLKPPAWLEASQTETSTQTRDHEPAIESGPGTAATALDKDVIDSIPSPNAASEPSVNETGVRDLAVANAPRSSLAYAGLSLLPSNLFTGSGPGILEVPLEGNTFGGITSTYSTHILYLDLLLMSGGPAFLLCMLAMVSAISAGLQHCQSHGSGSSSTQQALLGMLVVFAVSWLFLPQERNELIGLAFACAGFLISRQTQQTTLDREDSDNALPRRGLLVIALTAGGWAVVTSPVYVFPTIELVGRHGSEIITEQQKVYITEPASRPLLSALLKLRGGTSAQVEVLPDDINILKEDNIWILWSPTRETEYPELIKELDNKAYPKQLYPLGIGIPEHWWQVPSAQPVLSLLYAGTRETFESGIYTYPNLAHYLAIHHSDNVEGNPRDVTDPNLSGAVSWPSSTAATIDFDLDEAAPGILSIYRLVALNHQGMTRSMNYTWEVMGQLSNGEWIVIDIIKSFPLSQVIHEPSRFPVSPHSTVRKIRFHFLPEENSPDTAYSGLKKVELYFSPQRFNGAGRATHEN